VLGFFFTFNRALSRRFSADLDLSGGQDGSVRLWEFSHAQPVSIPRPPGTFAKVTRIRFHGNKFGVADGRLPYFIFFSPLMWMRSF